MDIHNYKAKLERTIKRLENSTISTNNQKILLEFKDQCLCDGISYGKVDVYLFYLIKFTGMVKKPLEGIEKEDIRKVMLELNQTTYSEETKASFKIAVRKLYKMIRDTEDYPLEVKWLKTTIAKNHTKIPEELLTEEEIESMIRSARTLRDKALLSTLAESGCRIGEIGTLQIKHISFEEHGARITVKGKTGMRKILIINSAPYLQSWINEHPTNNDSNSYLWVSQKGDCLCYNRITAILKLASKDVGIKKRVYPHILRHTRATRMALLMSEASLKVYFGWTQSSKVASIIFI